MIEGGCFCARIRYAIDDGNYLVANCHCQMCRKTSAAPFVPWIVVPLTTFRYTMGKPAILKSSDHGTRFFCQDCGTPLAFTSSERPAKVDVTSCSLDNPEDYPPQKAVHPESRLHWLAKPVPDVS